MKRSVSILLGVLMLGSAGCDPVHSDAVDALGGEAQGVRPGPLHRPGQPCLVCHDGAFGDPGEFSVAGTIFERPGSKQPVSGATVSLTDATGSSFRIVTNAAGNFYMTPAQWNPTYPVTVTLTADGLTVPMQTSIGRSGACATCHFDPEGPTSPGHVSVMLDDGGTPP